MEKELWQMTREEFLTTPRKGVVIKAYDHNRKISLGKITKILGKKVYFYKASNPKGYKHQEEDLDKVKQWLKEESCFIDIKWINPKLKANEVSLFDDYETDFHKWTVKQALKEGKPVPNEVLKDYPDLQRQQI